jgi:hypothetical protein
MGCRGQYREGAMTLPATLKDAEALIYAREDARYFRERGIDLLGINIRIFESEDGQMFAREMLKWIAYRHVDNLMTVVSWARQGWTLADEALREMYREMTDRGEFSTYLNSYMMEVARGQIRCLPGQRKESHFFRDVIIATMIEAIAEKFDLNPTRNQVTQRTSSACSIVAEVLGMSEPAVVKIWRAMKKYL